MKPNRMMLTGLLTTAVFLFFLAAPAVLAETYVIGSSIAITGPTNDVGSPYAKGIEDYCRFVNDMKLLGKDRVECIIRDDAYQTSTTKRNFEDFMDQGMIIYLNYSTGSTLGLKRDFEEEQIPVLPASFHAGNLDDSNYIFLPIASYSEQAIGLVEYVVANHSGGTPKIAMFLHPSAFGRGPLADVEKAIQAGLNAELVEVVEHGNDLDYTAMIKRLLSKDVQYVISQTTQPPVATLLKDARRLGKAATAFGEKGKLTFLGCHYAGGPDLIALAGTAAEGTFWTTSYTLTIEQGADAIPVHLAERYDRGEALGNSQNYMNGIMAIQVAIETIKRVKVKDKKVNKKTLYEELNAMNGANAYYPGTTVGPVTFSETDRAGVDALQLYLVEDNVYRSYGKPFTSTYYRQIK